MLHITTHGTKREQKDKPKNVPNISHSQCLASSPWPNIHCRLRLRTKRPNHNTKSLEVKLNKDPTSLLCNNHLCLLLMGMKVIPSLIAPFHNIKGIDPCKKYSMNWWILDMHQFDKLLGGVIMIFLLFDLGTRDGTNDCKYIHCPKNFMNDIWSLVSWWGECGEGHDLKIFGGLIASYLLNNVQSAVHNVFPICSWCTFFPYALPNVHLFCSHSSHVLSHFLCPIFLMLFLKFPWFPIMFPISNNLCWKVLL